MNPDDLSLPQLDNKNPSLELGVDLSWIKESPRASYFMYSLLKQGVIHKTVLSYDNMMEYPTCPQNDDIRFNIVRDSISSMCINMPRIQLYNVIDEFRGRWAHIFNYSPYFNWLVKSNHEQCRWVWLYLRARVEHAMLFQPLDSEGQYHAALAILDSWGISPEAMTLFFMKMSKAWRQKEFRKENKKNGKVPINTYLKKDIKKMLDKISNENNETMVSTIERLIRKEYRTLFEK